MYFLDIKFEVMGALKGKLTRENVSLLNGVRRK